MIKQPSSPTECREYTEWTVENHLYGSMLLIPTLTKVTTSKCDISRGLIVGGVKVMNPKEFPHMCGIGYKDNWGSISFSCGGSLISDQFGKKIFVKI